MKRVRAALLGVYDFIVGEDWLLAVGTVAVLLLGWLAHGLAGSWLLLLIGVPLVLLASVARSIRRN